MCKVCLSVPCSFKECPQSTRSSGAAPKPESKYHLSRAVILGGHGHKSRYLHLTFTSLYPFNSSVICCSNLSGKKITRCELRVDASLKVHERRCCSAVPKFEKQSFKRSNETVNLPRAKVKRGNRAVIKIYGSNMTG